MALSFALPLGACIEDVREPEPVANSSVTAANARFVHPTLDPRWASYRSARRDQLFLYQGDLRNFGATPVEVARVMRPFDVVVLTNAIPCATSDQTRCPRADASTRRAGRA